MKTDLRRMEMGLVPRRTKFLDTLKCMSERQRAHLLGVETSEELEALFQLALDQQWFEIAASVRTETRRRKIEIKVEPV